MYFSTPASVRSHRTQLIGVLSTQDQHQVEKGRDARDVIIMSCARSERLISIIYVREIRR